jgi:hypothetical protein
MNMLGDIRRDDVVVLNLQNLATVHNCGCARTRYVSYRSTYGRVAHSKLSRCLFPQALGTHSCLFHFSIVLRCVPRVECRRLPARQFRQPDLVKLINLMGEVSLYRGYLAS